MASIVGVTLNQPTALGTSDAEIERFAILYESEAASRGDAAFQDLPFPSVKRTVAAEPRLDITAQVEGEGTRLKATLARTEVGSTGIATTVEKQVSVLLTDVDAMAATQGLVEVLNSTSEDKLRPVSADALANRLYEELQVLIDELNSLFDDLELVLFAPLPDDLDLPDLDQFTFTDPYYERFWQLTWASWSGERDYDVETMVGLGFRSSAMTTLGVDFTRRVVDSVAPDDDQTA